MASFNCFKLREDPVFLSNDIGDASSGNLSLPTYPSGGPQVLLRPPTSCYTPQPNDIYPTASGSSGNNWLRPITSFRHSSAFSSCMSPPTRLRDSLSSNNPPPFSPDDFVSESLVGSIGGDFSITGAGCLVRSQSDSTCLSWKASSSSDQPCSELIHDVVVKPTNDSHNLMSASSVASNTEVGDESPRDPSDLSSANPTPEFFSTSWRRSTIHPVDRLQDSNSPALVPGSTSSPIKKQRYQLICQNGVQSYMRVSPTSLLDEDNCSIVGASGTGDILNNRKSCGSLQPPPRYSLVVADHNGSFNYTDRPSNQLHGSDASFSDSTSSSQHQPPHKSLHHHGVSASLVSGPVDLNNNLPRSSHHHQPSSDLSSSNPGHRKPGSSNQHSPRVPPHQPLDPSLSGNRLPVTRTSQARSSASRTSASHHQQPNWSNAGQLEPGQVSLPSSYAQKPPNSLAPPPQSSSASSSTSNPRQPPPPPLPRHGNQAVSNETGMTLGEMRSIAERQRQQLARQAQQLQMKEERLAWLRSASRQAKTIAQQQAALGGDSKLPSAGSELNEEQEMKLHKLRSLRGQTEQVRLANETLVKEIDNFARLLSLRERDLELCRQRVNLAKQTLSSLAQGRSRISDKSQTGLSAAVMTDLMSMPLAFPAQSDKQRWLDGLAEAANLDLRVAQPPPHGQQQSSAFVRPPSSSSHAFHSSLVGQSPANPSSSYTGFRPITTKSTSLRDSPPDPNTGSSLLSRASSPNRRRPYFRMVMQRSASPAASISGESAVTDQPPLLRIKAPPRYASRAVINDTYMRRLCRDNLDKYKRAAAQVYQANIDKMTPTPQPSNSQGRDDPTPDDGEIVAILPNRSRTPSTCSADSSSSDSSLEIVAIGQPTLEEKSDVLQPEAPPTDQVSVDQLVIADTDANKDGDSGIGCSDDTQSSDQQQQPAGEELSSPSDQVDNVIVNAFVNDDDEVVKPVELAEADANLLDFVGNITDCSPADAASPQPKSILRIKRLAAPLAQPEEQTSGGGDEGNISDPLTNDSGRPRPTNPIVRFHPLALLLDAALEGDLELVKSVAEQVTDVSEPNDEGITALHNAVCAGRLEVAEFLVKSAGADVNAGDTDGWTPLHCAASCGNLILARLLVEHGASLHARTLSDQETPQDKCDQADEADCEEYLYFQQERLGSAYNGRVYALFPRGPKAAGPGSPDSLLEPDELEIWPNEQLTVTERRPPGETEWLMAANSAGVKGLVPRSHVSCYALVRIPPASQPPSTVVQNLWSSPVNGSELADPRLGDDLESGDQSAVVGKTQLTLLACPTTASSSLTTDQPSSAPIDEPHVCEIEHDSETAF